MLAVEENLLQYVLALKVVVLLARWGAGQPPRQMPQWPLCCALRV